MPTKTPAKRSCTAAARQTSAKAPSPRRHRSASESAARAVKSGRAAARALKDTATEAGSAAMAVAGDVRSTP
jgi:hypothetical protein